MLEEAIELRKINDQIDILMMGPIDKKDLKYASKYRIEITLHDEDLINQVIDISLKITVHLKIDTGMLRYGITGENQITKAIENLQNNNNIDLKGLYTHFSTANDGYDFFLEQKNRFELLLTQIKDKPRVVHMSNSAATLKYESNIPYTTHVRYGISLYGLSLDKIEFNLKPAMVLKTKIVSTKVVEKGACVGYGQTYCFNETARIGIIPIGYADGLLRRNKYGDVEINGKRYKIVGNICMDATYILIDETVSKGDEVIIFGQLITANEMMERNKTIHYEILTSISNRVKRIYVEGGKHER